MPSRVAHQLRKGHPIQTMQPRPQQHTLNSHFSFMKLTTLCQTEPTAACQHTMSSADSSLPPPPPDPLYTLRPHAGAVTDIKFIPSPTEGLITGFTSGCLGVWSLTSKREVWRRDCGSPVISVSPLSTSNHVLSQLRSNELIAWDLEKQTQLSSMTIDRAGFCKLAMVQTSKEGYMSSFPGMSCFAVAHSEYGKVNIYDYQSKLQVETLSVEKPENKGMCMCVSMHMDPGTGMVYVFGGFEDGSIVLWDGRFSNKELASIKIYPEPVMCMAMDSDRGGLVAGSATNSVEKIQFTLEQQSVFVKKFSVELKNSGVASVAIRDDGKIFCSGGWDGRIRVFGWKKGKPLAVLNYHSETANTCAFVPSSVSPIHSNLLVCGSKDERISIWKIY